MLRNSIYIVFIPIVLMTSCLSKKTIPAGVSSDKIEMAPEAVALLDKVRATQLPYTWFSASGQGKIDWDGQRFSARINVRILRDSVIWVQIQKLGFEVGRMLVTPDSAFFINRLERSYSVYATNDFLEEYKVPADFEMFSKVFTAGAYMPALINKSVMEQDGSVLLTSGNGMIAQHWFDASSFLIRSIITDPMDREWSAVYAEYRQTNSGQAFPYKRSNTVVIDGESNIFDLEYSELMIDVPQEFPFSIPSHYEKI